MTKIGLYWVIRRRPMSETQIKPRPKTANIVGSRTVVMLTAQLSTLPHKVLA